MLASIPRIRNCRKGRQDDASEGPMRESAARIVVILLSLNFCPVVSTAREDDRTLTLVYVPQESTGAPMPSLDTAIVSRPVEIIFEDAREQVEPSVVGDGTGDDDQHFVWKASNDVKKFCHQTFVRIVSGWGVRSEPGASRILRVRLNQFNLSERDQAVGSMYLAEVRVTGQMEERAGDVLGLGAGAGDARRYGKKRSGQNSIEVLSDAMKEAFANLLDDSALRAAWAGRKVSANIRSTERDVSPAELLADLVKLKAQGFTSDLLVEFVRQRTLSASLTAEEMVAWKQAGMSEPVIRMALERAPVSKSP